MLIKTIDLPSAHSETAEVVHQLLLAPPAFEWSLEFRSPDPTGGGIDQLRPRFTITPPDAALAWISKITAEAYSTQLGQRILDRKQPLQLGGVTVRIPELARVRLDQSSIANGYLTLPPISVDLPGFPDPTIVGIKSESGRSFLIHLRGRVSGAPLEVRLRF